MDFEIEGMSTGMAKGLRTETAPAMCSMSAIPAGL